MLTLHVLYKSSGNNFSFDFLSDISYRCPYDLTLSNFSHFKVILASGDATGNIFIWDVTQAVVVSSLPTGVSNQIFSNVNSQIWPFG